MRVLHMPLLFTVMVLLGSFGFGLKSRVTIPVTFAGLPGKRQAGPTEVVFEPDLNPVKFVRRFCAGYNLPRSSCKHLWEYALSIMDSSGIDTTTPITGCKDDTIWAESGGFTIQSVLVCGSTEFRTNLQQLNGREQSAALLLPVAYSDVTRAVKEFCSLHGISGQMCEDLHFEARNYYTSLYFRPGGVSLRNLFEGMHYHDDLDSFHFYLDVVNPVDGTIGRYFYHSIATYYSLMVSRICTQHRLAREQCSRVFSHAYQAAGQFAPHRENELATSVYVYAVLDHLSKRANNTRAVEGSADLSDDQSGTVDMDFIEIGTSNFNTISQMLDRQVEGGAGAGLRGLSVEPSLEYLSQLPEHWGVTKVNAAIVTEAERLKQRDSQLLVDLYYIPERVIDEMQQGQFLKGCNSIGDYHLMHRRAGVMQYVQVAKVPALTIRQLLTDYRVRRIRLLKIDAEGYDLTILNELYLYLVARKDPVLYPERILFETNDPTRAAEVRDLISLYTALGYVVMHSGEDTIMEYKPREGLL